jgi:hypothetical protein
MMLESTMAPLESLVDIAAVKSEEVLEAAAFKWEDQGPA